MNNMSTTKYLITFAITLLWSGITFSQNSPERKLANGDTYALIIGISDYQDDKIRDLNFAHKDAEAFADYLTSRSGGDVPDENIKLFTNDQATIANIYNAKQNIERKVKKGDLVYFYFSGHGDVEGGLYKLGFLLAHDTPHKNYLTNAIRIEDINMMANILSVEKGVKVVLITDACHSGRLAGSDNRGSFLAGEQLTKSQNNEIRLASCEADQKSHEGNAWGGGRGVFSYYLINGLMGLADDYEDKDGVISVMEIKSYLEKKVSKDVVKIKAEDQIPVVKGKSLAPISIVNDDELAALQQNVDLSSSVALSAKGMSYTPSPEDQYFEKLSSINLMEIKKFKVWKDQKAKKIIQDALDQFSYIETKEIKNSKWRKKIQKSKNLRREYGERFASEIHNDVQLLLNKYMTNSSYSISSNQSDYQYKELEQCANMLQTALKLIDEDNYLYKVMKVKMHYSKGLAARFKIPFSDDPQSLIDLAIEEQKKAMAIEDKAAFVHYEMQMVTTITTTKSTKTKKRIVKSYNTTTTRKIKN